jgi:hypothetical protein
MASGVGSNAVSSSLQKQVTSWCAHRGNKPGILLLAGAGGDGDGGDVSVA